MNNETTNLNENSMNINDYIDKYVLNVQTAFIIVHKKPTGLTKRNLVKKYATKTRPLVHFFTYKEYEKLKEKASNLAD